MMMLQMMAYSALMGFVGMGFVWYGWGVVENLLAARRNALINKAVAEAEDNGVGAAEMKHGA